MSCYSTGYGDCMDLQMSNPLTYCAVSQLDASFNHPSTGRVLGPDSMQCKRFMASYGAMNWDSHCENIVKSKNRTFHGNVCSIMSKPGEYTEGEVLIANTASEKYLVAMSDNCHRVYEPFDPTVQNSPLISKWVPKENCGASCGPCIPIFDVEAKNLDKDPVMNHILFRVKPSHQLWIIGLKNIYATRMRNKNMGELAGTKLYKLFGSPWFQGMMGKKS